MLKKIITAVASIALALATVTVIEVPTSNAAATRTVQLSAPKGINAGTLADYSLRINWLNVSNNSGYNVKLYNNVDKLITQSGQLAKDSLGFTFGFNAFFLKKNTTYRVTVTTIGGSTVGSVTYKTSPESRRISVKTSLAISINAGNNQSATVGTAVSIAPSVIVKDANNNLVSGVNVTFAVASGGGLIIGESATTDSSGIATVGSWTLGTAAGNNTLSATSGSLTNSPLTFTATATAGSATTIAINAGDSQSAAVGTAVSIAPSVIVKDANNNPVSGVNVTFTVETGGGAIVNTAAQITDGSGIASAGTWTLGTAAGNNTLSATSGSLTNSPLTFTATATAGTAASAVITTQPTGAVSGTVFTGQPVIKIVDSNGNTVTGFTDNVVAAIATGVGTLSGTTTQTAVAGVATFTDLVITGAAGNFTLTFTPSAGTAVTSDSFALTVPVTPAAPSVTADDTANTITGLDIATMEYSSDGGSTWSQAPAPTFAGNQTVLVRVKAQGINPASANTTLTFTTNPTYAIGATGPGGGIVFYYNAAGFNCGVGFTSTGSLTGGLCYYLEAAPTETSVTGYWIDAVYEWSGNTSTIIGTPTAIGSGYQNTIAITTQNNIAEKAGTISRAYRGPNSLTDWYLPSKDELNQMCKWARGQAWVSDATVCDNTGSINSGIGAAGFVENDYWSSSDNNALNQPLAWYQSFRLGFQTYSYKNAALYVRPIRAFSNPAPFTSSPTYALSASPTVGSPVTASPTGSWSPSSPTLHYQWKRSDNGTTGWSDVTTNSDSASYTPVSGDVGKYLEVVVTASTAGYTNSVVTSSASAVVAAAVPQAYAIGATGPGGGIVFYFNPNGFNCGANFTSTGSPTGGLCNFLEVAPSGWSGGSDPTMSGAVPEFQFVLVPGIAAEPEPNNTFAGIGLGYLNSLNIIEQNGAYDSTTNKYAAGSAHAYSGNGKTDWYLPSEAELNALCQWDNGETQSFTTECRGGNPNSAINGALLAGFDGSGCYWSSSQLDAQTGWCLYFDGQGHGIARKSWDGANVRPIRAFGAPSFTSSPTYALSASPTVGSPVTASPTGSWSPSSPTLHYQWKRSDNGTTGWSDVTTNSDSASYTPVSGDVGKYLEVVVTASAAGYTNSVVTSSASAVVAAAVPQAMNSMYFNGSGALKGAMPSSIDAGTSTYNDFTYEAWVKPTDNTNSESFIDNNYSSTGGINLTRCCDYSFFYFGADGWGRSPEFNGTLPTNVWTHVAVVRLNGLDTFYINGVALASNFSDTHYYNKVDFAVGGNLYGGFGNFTGYLARVQISRTARYIGNFTASTTRLVADSYTLLLLDPTDANFVNGASGSGAITNSGSVTFVLGS